MPVQQLKSGEQFSVQQGDVIGLQNQPTLEVFHVGIALKKIPKTVARSTRNPVEIIHMAPPFEEDRKVPANLIGQMGLEEDELADIMAYLFRRRDLFAKNKAPADFPFEEKFYQYIVLPHSEEPTKQRPAGRFSCAGLVYESYAAGGITLIELDRIPAASLESLCKVYPALEMAIKNDLYEILWNFGLTGPGPWPIMMPGYLMASLNRSVEEIRQTPYAPNPGDVRFL